VLGDQFWSGGAIALGLEKPQVPGDVMHAKATRAVKLTAVPGVLTHNACLPSPQRPDSANIAYLRDDLAAHLARGPICANSYMQFQEDPLAQPVEDTSVEWKTSEVRVGRIVIQQMNLDSEEAVRDEAFCNELTFSPWNALTEHRPLGNIMRARKATYARSAAGRGSHPEPTGDEPR
jgi:hypothetical protein